MKVNSIAGYLLVIYSYMEEETYFYHDIDKLLCDFDCKNLEQLFEEYNCFIYVVSNVFRKEII